MRTTLVSLILFLALFLYSVSSWAGDPFSGSNIYAQYCVNCHGADGRGELAGTPSFRGGRLMMRPDAEIRNIVKHGKNMMPSFTGVLEEYQIDDVVAYIRTFN